MMNFDAAAKSPQTILGDATVPYAYWNFQNATSAATALYTNKTLGALTAFGTPSYASRAGWVTLDDASGYTFDNYSTADLTALFELGQGIMLFAASVNMNALATTQNHLLSIGAGAGPQLRFSLATNTTWRPDVWIAFDGQTSATQYAGGTNEVAAATDTNIVLLIDNRVGVKTLYRYVNGTNLNGSSWSGTNPAGSVTMSQVVTKRIRLFADANNSPGSTFYGACRRMWLVNYGTTMPTRINDIVQELNQYSGIPSPVLAQSLVR